MSWNPFKNTDEKRVVDAIRSAEQMCSGEVRVHLDEYCKGDVVLKAQNVFKHLEMDQTNLRNGILIYVALKEKKFCILGDVGIDEKVPSDFWETTKDLMKSHFAKGQIIDGIVTGIEEAGAQLKTFFPYQDNDKDELSNDISYGE